MMFSNTVTTALMGLVMFAAPLASAHMSMLSPPSLGHPQNTKTTEANKDYNMNSPLDPSGSNYPCRGHLNLLGTADGASVATWSPGSTQEITITGSAFHNGGSCQALLSYDQGKSWTVIHTWMGNCPVAGGGTFPFQVPSDAPTGSAVFAWSWFNHSGNREMYQNCAAITIGGGGARKKRSSGTAFSARPGPFLANIGNGCTTVEGGDTIIPNPGPDVTNTSNNLIAAVGNCGVSGGGSGPSTPDTGNDSSVAPPSPSSTDASTPSPVESGSATVIRPSVSHGAFPVSEPSAPAPGQTKQCKRKRRVRVRGRSAHVNKA